MTTNSAALTSAQKTQQGNRNPDGTYRDAPLAENNAASLDRNAGPKQTGEYIDVVEQSRFGRDVVSSVNAATGFSDTEFTTISDHYLVAVLWTEQNDGQDIPEDEDELDGSQTVSDFTAETRKAAEADLFKFLSENKDLVDEAKKTEYGDHTGDTSGFLGSIGHDFWLTRNHEGAGFWDRDALSAGGLGDKLTEAAQKFHEQSAWCFDGRVSIE